MFYLYAFIISFYITIVLIPPLCRYARRVALVDHPDERKVHQAEIPRIGGVGIIAGTLIPILMWFLYYGFPLTKQFKAYLIGIGILFITGILDDRFTLSYQKKLIGQGLAACAAIFIGHAVIMNLGVWDSSGELLLPALVAVPLSFFFIIGITNAVNLSDGLDGLAGGISVFIFLSLAVISYLDGRIDLLIGCLAITGAIIAFLRYNSFPAKVFMGDTGSLFLGFSAAIISLYLTQSPSSAIARTLPLMILGLPIMDTLSVMTTRIMRRENPFKPDRKHLHHQLLKLGFNHKYAVLLIYIIQSLIVFLSIRLMYASEPVIIGIYCILLTTILGAFYLAHRIGWQFKGGTGIIVFWNRYVSSAFSRWLKKKSLQYINLTLSFGLIWLALSSPLTLGFNLVTILGILFMTMGALFIRGRFFSVCFKITISVFMALLLFNSQHATIFQLPFSQQLFHYCYWGSIAGAVMLYLLMTRFRTYEISTIDYIILVMVVSLSFVPVEFIGRWRLGTVAGGMLVFFWSNEILARNQKRMINLFTWCCLISTIIIFIRYLTLNKVFFI